jgi:hypothetical protein
MKRYACLLLILSAVALVSCTTESEETPIRVEVAYPFSLNDDHTAFIKSKGEDPTVVLSIARSYTDSLSSIIWNVNGSTITPTVHKETLGFTYKPEITPVITSVTDYFEAKIPGTGSFTVTLTATYRSGRSYTKTTNYTNSGKY